MQEDTPTQPNIHACTYDSVRGPRIKREVKVHALMNVCIDVAAELAELLSGRVGIGRA